MRSSLALLFVVALLVIGRAGAARADAIVPPRRTDGAPVRYPVDGRGDAVVSARVEFPPPAVAPAPTPTPAPSETVSVQGRREELGTIHLRREESRLVPGTFGDPLRSVEVLPGMTPWLSGLPYYFVRGSPPEDVGYTVDGIRVPLLFHAGAAPSTLAPSLVDSVDLDPGAYPARYGRYAGALVAAETAPPRTDRVRAEGEARIFDASAFTEVPVDEGRGSVMAAARYGYTDLVIQLVAPKYRVGYWDYQARAAHGAWGRDTVSVLVFGSHDELAYLGAPTFHVEYHRADLRYDHPFEAGHLRIAATLGADDAFTALQTATGAGTSAALRGPTGRLRAELDARASDTVRVRAGADAAVVRFDEDDDGRVAHARHTDFEAGAYVDAIWRPAPALEIVPGLRLDAYDARGASVLAPQPRLSARLRFGRGVTWISAVGTAHQEPTEAVFVPAKLPSAIDLASRDAYQASEAIDVRLPERVRVRVTGFASRIVARGASASLRTEGVELFVARDLTERLGGVVSYTLARADTTLGAAAGEAPWDRTHVLSVSLAYDLGAGWRVGGRFFVESGRRYAVACPAAGCAPGPAAPPAVAATGRLPAFYRVDARVERRWSFAEGRWLAIAFECFNALGAAEPTGAQWAPASGVSLTRQAPLVFPSFGVSGGM